MERKVSSQQQQYGNGRSPRLDALFAEAEVQNQDHRRKASNQKQDVQNALAHRQGKYQRDHAGNRHNTEHSLPQADLMVKDDFKPFFQHLNALPF